MIPVVSVRLYSCAKLSAIPPYRLAFILRGTMIYFFKHLREPIIEVSEDRTPRPVCGICFDAAELVVTMNILGMHRV